MTTKEMVKQIVIELLKDAQEERAKKDAMKHIQTEIDFEDGEWL